MSNTGSDQKWKWAVGGKQRKKAGVGRWRGMISSFSSSPTHSCPQSNYSSLLPQSLQMPTSKPNVASSNAKIKRAQVLVLCNPLLFSSFPLFLRRTSKYRCNLISKYDLSTHNVSPNLIRIQGVWKPTLLLLFPISFRAMGLSSPVSFSGPSPFSSIFFLWGFVLNPQLIPLKR